MALNGPHAHNAGHRQRARGQGAATCAATASHRARLGGAGLLGLGGRLGDHVLCGKRCVRPTPASCMTETECVAVAVEEEVMSVGLVGQPV